MHILPRLESAPPPGDQVLEQPEGKVGVGRKGKGDSASDAERPVGQQPGQPSSTAQNKQGPWDTGQCPIYGPGPPRQRGQHEWTCAGSRDGQGESPRCRHKILGFAFSYWGSPWC